MSKRANKIVAGILYQTDRQLKSKRVSSSYSSLDHYHQYDDQDDGGMMLGEVEIGEVVAEIEPATLEDNENELRSESDSESVAEGSEREEDDLSLQEAIIDCQTENIDRMEEYDPYWPEEEQEPESYDLRRLLLYFLPKLQDFNITESYRKITNPPPDYLLPLHSSSPSTTGQFATDLVDLCDINNINDSVRVALLDVLKKHFPHNSGFNFPVNKLDKYRSSIGRHYEEYDVCPSGCMVYVGRGREGLINSGRAFLDRCRKCNQSRYTNENNQVAGRTPKAVVHYRPLVPLLIHLCRSEVFRALINYETVGRASHNSFIFDQLQGEEPRRNIKEMDANHASWCNSGATEDEIHYRQGWTSVNILLGTIL